MVRTKSKFVMACLVALLAFGANAVCTTTTYLVGTCKTGPKSFTTIQLALDALPAPTTVQICPGTYREQLAITQAVTLQGISTAASSAVIILPPSTGLAANASLDLGGSVAAQIYVNASGPVNLTNLTVDGTGNNVSCCYVVGVFYRETAGAIKHVTTRYQQANIKGVGIVLEGGSSIPSVSVENSDVRYFDDIGIWAETNSASSELKVTVQGNVVYTPGDYTGIRIDTGTTATVTGNIVNAATCIVLSGVAGSVSGNTLVSLGFGVELLADGMSVTNNKMAGGDAAGIAVVVPITTSQITGNTISSFPDGIAIYCNATNNNIHSNTIADATYGLAGVPPGVVFPNTYFGVTTNTTPICE